MSSRLAIVRRLATSSRVEARVPSIHFLGKRSLLVHDSSSKLVLAPAASPSSKDKPPSIAPIMPNKPVKPTTPGAILFTDTPIMFRHIAISKEEMDAVMSGGAY